METIASTIAPGADRMLDSAETLLKDVPAEKFARLADPGGKPIDANHAAFIYGHLALYPARIMLAAGEDEADVSAPGNYVDLFAAGAECRDDPEGSIYPPMDEIVRVFFDGHRRLLEHVKTWPDERLAARHAIEGRLAEIFPLLGQLTNFILIGHAYMHLGQMSTWRRAIGLGSAM
jgi:hypothetical protein